MKKLRAETIINSNIENSWNILFSRYDLWNKIYLDIAYINLDEQNSSDKIKYYQAGLKSKKTPSISDVSIIVKESTNQDDYKLLEWNIKNYQNTNLSLIFELVKIDEDRTNLLQIRLEEKVPIRDKIKATFNKEFNLDKCLLEFENIKKIIESN